MREHAVDACLLFNEPNIRYATGASAMPIYSMSTFVRCALVPSEGRPILFEHRELCSPLPSSGRGRAPDARVGVLRRPGVRSGDLGARDQGGDGRARRERRTRSRSTGSGRPASSPCQSEGVGLVDSAPITQEAREVKTPEEIQLFEVNGAVGRGDVVGVRAVARPRRAGTRSAGCAVGHRAARWRRVSGDEHRMLRPQHQPVEVGGDGACPR